MNILSFDIEEWSLEKDYFGNDSSRYKLFDSYLDWILETLEANNQSATFFCLGKIATDFPHVINKIASAGHEVGCHSYAHRWVNKMTCSEFREDTHKAVSEIENLIGSKVVSYRAPAFSIGETNKWAYDVLIEAGIQNDASIFPAVRDFGGFPAFNKQTPCVIEYNGSRINEFPIPLFRLPMSGYEMAYSGGGYFRLLPLRFVKRQMANRSYNMCYFHIADLLNEKTPLMNRRDFETYFKVNGSFIRRYIRYVKANIGRSHSVKNLGELAKYTRFCSIRDYNVNSPITEVINI